MEDRLSLFASLRLCVIYICLALHLYASVAAAQDNTLNVVFEKPAGRSTVVGAFRARGILYASLTDLVQVFGVTSYTNPTTAKMEVKAGGYRVKVTAGSPFLVVADQAQRQTVYQLPVNVLYAANAFFIPVYPSLQYFHVLFDKSGRFDPATGTLYIGTPPPPTAFDIPSLVLEPKANGMLIRITSQKKIDDVESWLRPDGWYYVTLADVHADVRTINATRSSGIVKNVVAFQSPTSVQLTFKLEGKIAAAEILRDDHSNDLLLSIRTSDLVQKPTILPETKSGTTAGKKEIRPPEKMQEIAVDQTPVTAPDETKEESVPKHRPETTPGEKKESVTEKKPAAIPPADLSSQKKRWELDVIVIDPGHGGKDPGAIGVTGVKEKNVTLGIARQLGRLIEGDRSGLRGVKTVFTRSTDVFVPLYRRGQIANESGGKLFISIHCNSMAKRPNPRRGFEVYLLRPGRTEEAIAIAEQENAVIQLEEGYEERYQELTDENFILVTMAQSAYVRSSERLADLTQKQLAAIEGLQNQGVKQAGFYVLVGASMPNILVETAFLSNREDEKFLNSTSGQKKIAEGLYRAIRKYKAEYEKLLADE